MASCGSRLTELTKEGSELGLPPDFVRKGLLLLRIGYVRELAVASYPHIQCGSGDFPCIAGGVCGGWRRFFSNGCKSHPAIAPAGSSRSSHGGNEVAEAFG